MRNRLQKEEPLRTEPESQERLDAAMAAFDAANARDPNRETYDGREWPKELLYAHRMTGWLERMYPDASEPLRLAVRAQHLERWRSPRDSYPRDRVGYLKWRADLKNMHADRADEIMHAAGYDDDSIERVRSLIRKEHLKSDTEVQALEDVACLVFLENYFAAFARDHDAEKLIGILRKTWAKMSKVGHEAALALDLPADARALVEKALAG